MTADPTTPSPSLAMAPVGLDAALGLRVVRCSGDEVVLEYDIAATHLQPFGIVHGGTHCAVAESACSMGASMVAIARGQAGAVGLENHTSFLHAARGGRVTVTALPLSRGRRSQLWEAVARDTDGKILATSRVRLLCLDAGGDLAGKPVSRQA